MKTQTFCQVEASVELKLFGTMDGVGFFLECFLRVAGIVICCKCLLNIYMQEELSSMYISSIMAVDKLVQRYIATL